MTKILSVLVFGSVLWAQTQTVESRRIVLDGTSRQITDWESFPVRTVSSLPPLASVEQDTYGGRTDRRGHATGYFHTELRQGRWWIVDPLGALYISDGVDSVAPGGTANNEREFAKKFGNVESWASATERLLLSNGFNSLGSWSDVDSLSQTGTEHVRHLSYSINLNIMGEYGRRRGGVHMGSGHLTYPNDAVFVFDPDFAKFADKYLSLIEKRSRDPKLLGYFSDNEIPLALNNLDGFLSRPQNDPGHIAAEAFLRAHHASSPTDELRAAFLEKEASRYFQIVSGALRKHDPNHMYLGCRFYGKQLRQPEMFRAIAKYADIVSINFYGRWQLDQELASMWEKESNKPFLVTEFYVKAADTRMPNASGAGWIVQTQKDRGLFYENFAIALLQSKSCVGWHWFRYQDNDPDDNSADPSNVGSNKGIVDMSYDPYTALLTSMRDVNRHIYAIADFFAVNGSSRGDR